MTNLAMNCVIMMGGGILMGMDWRAGDNFDGGWLMGDEPHLISMTSVKSTEVSMVLYLLSHNRIILVMVPDFSCI